MLNAISCVCTGVMGTTVACKQPQLNVSDNRTNRTTYVQQLASCLSSCTQYTGVNFNTPLLFLVTGVNIETSKVT